MTTVYQYGEFIRPKLERNLVLRDQIEIRMKLKEKLCWTSGKDSGPWRSVKGEPENTLKGNNTALARRFQIAMAKKSGTVPYNTDASWHTQKHLCQRSACGHKWHSKGGMKFKAHWIWIWSRTFKWKPEQKQASLGDIVSQVL